MEDVLFVVIALMPALFALWIANLADHQREQGRRDGGLVLALVAYASVGLLYAGLLFVGLLLQVFSAFTGGQLPEGLEQSGMDVAALLAALPVIGLGMWLPSLLALIVFLRPVRRLISRLIPINAESTVHAVALSLPSLVLVNLIMTVGMGLDNLAAMLESNAAAGASYNPFPGIWAQNLLFLILSVIGVGWLSGRRGISAALDRLGLTRPTPRQALAGLVLGLVLVPVVLGVEALSTWLGWGPAGDVERLTEQLIGPLTRSIPGILTLGLAAALGEEAIFRGALQPRFGLALTSLLFALMHAQYGFSLSSLFVLAIGFVLGIVRQRANTSTSMIAHAIYNISLGVIAYLSS